MITGELRSKVDRIWETFWTGGYYQSIRSYRAVHIFTIYEATRRSRVSA